MPGFIVLEIEFLPYHPAIILEIRRGDGKAFVCFEPCFQIIADDDGATILRLGHIGGKHDAPGGEIYKLVFTLCEFHQLALVGRRADSREVREGKPFH